MSNLGPVQRRQAQRRRDRLEHIERQLAEGSLTIRKMTKKERKRWGPPKDPAAARKRAKRRETLDAS